MTNCIVWGNAAGGIFGSVAVTYCDVEGGWAGRGNISRDPLFADADGRLSAKSPCIDAGTNAPTGGLTPTDIEGNPRPLDGNGDGRAVADMGAYERPAVRARSASTEQLLTNLAGAVASLDLPNETRLSLNGRLKTAKKMLRDHNNKGDTAAAKALNAFCTNVETQRGKSVSVAQADALIASAQQIVRKLAKS